MANVFDQFDQPAPVKQTGNVFDQFDAPAAASTPTPAKGEMKAWEPSALEEVVNVGKRGLLQAKLTWTAS